MSTEPPPTMNVLPFPPKLCRPNAIEPHLSVKQFPYDKFMTSWSVVASTLPLWKTRKNVRLTYDPIEGTPTSKAFLDTVSYNSAKDPKGTKPSTILGVDCMEPIRVSVDGKQAAQEAGDEENCNGARWKWRGKGWLMIASTHWQVLGYHIDGGDDDWVVSYFGKTMFTPPGLDVLVRNPEKFDKAKIKIIIEACQNIEDEKVKQVSAGFYDVARDEA